MAITTYPYIPETITVHLGAFNRPAQNVTVPFQDYIKNVASSEIYPTWDEEAIRANILAQISYALNRIYTEYYPSRGYPFQITSTTAMDQKYIHERDIFENISLIVDEIFDSYLHREGYAEPLAAKFCNGTTTQCDGLSQWGSEDLAQQGYAAMEIIRYYYGEDVERVNDVPIRSLSPSYPGSPLTIGSIGADVAAVQTALNRISEDYPAIPYIAMVDGVYGPETAEAVRTFQRIFKLTPDAVVGKGTWYKIVNLYSGVKQLSELASEGQEFFDLNLQYTGPIQEGDQDERVIVLQYFLNVLAQFSYEIPPFIQDGYFGPRTRAAVMAFQRANGLQETGVVNRRTWELLVQDYLGIDRTVLDQEALVHPNEMTQFPGMDLTY